MSTILIVSALEKNERQIILKHLNEVKEARHPITGTDYYEGRYGPNDKSFKIVLVRTDQTNVNAGIETERALSYYNPSHIFFVGIAGGLKDVVIGDIVIGQDVYGYERGKADAKRDGKNVVSIFKPRPKFGTSSYAMERAATQFSFSEKWEIMAANLVDKRFNQEISVYTGTIAAGEKVVTSIDADLFNFLKLNCSHALAVEMEGIGFLEACRAYPEIQTLLIRGISDLVEDKSKTDNLGSQEYASKNAAAFLFAFIDTLFDFNLNKNLSDDFLDVICKLYPEGVKDNRIWVRAGGDLSKLQLNSNGMTQWVDALDLISKGGGGDIDKTSLIKIINHDFPKVKTIFNKL